MKKLLLLLIFCVFILTKGYCQQYYDSEKAPCAGKPNKSAYFFEWRTPSDAKYTLYVRDNAQQPIVMQITPPWFDRNNPNCWPLEASLTKDWNPEDGWEPIQRDFGGVGRHVDHPHMILYNKYTSTLRIFVAISRELNSKTYAVIRLQHPDQDPYILMSGQLEHYSGHPYTNPLERFSNKAIVAVMPNYYANTRTPFWTYADFTIAYDPCVCNYRSRLHFDVELVTESSLQFQLNGQLLENVNNVGIGGGASGFRQSLSAVQNAADGSVKAATSSFNNFSKGVEMLEKLNLIKDSSAFLKNWVPGLGAAFGAVNFLLGALGQQGGSAPAPLSFKVNMTAKGSITTQSRHNPRSFDLPASDLSTEIYYDNYMGIFSVLTTPKAHYYSVFKHKSKFTGDRYITYRLSGLPLYAVNDQLGIPDQDIEIRGCFEFVLKSSQPGIFRSLNNDFVAVNDSTYQSPALPLKCLTDYAARVAIYNDLGFNTTTMRIANIYLKLFVKLKRDAATSSVDDIVYIARYPIEFIEQTSNSFAAGLPMLPSSTVSITSKANQVPPWIQQPTAYDYNIPMGTTLEVNAMDEIILNSRMLFINGGGTLKLTAPVISTPMGTPTAYGGQLVLNRALPQICNSPTSRATPSQIRAFCGDPAGRYREQIRNAEYAKARVFIGAEADVPDLPDAYDLLVFPNPSAEDWVNVSYSLEEPSTVTIIIQDMAGRTLATPIEGSYRRKGGHEHKIMLQVIPPGSI